MKKMSKATVLSSVLLVALILAAPAFGQSEESEIRVAHLSPDAPNVSVNVNGKPVDTLENLPFGTVSSYVRLPSGSQDVEIYAAGQPSEPVLEASLDLRGGAAYTIGAVGLVEDGSLAAKVYEDDNSLPAEGNAKLRVFHAVPDVDAVDIAPRGNENIFTDLGFPNVSEYAEIPAAPARYVLEVKPSGSDKAAFTIPDVTLSAGSVYSAFVVGQVEAGTIRVLVNDDTRGKGGQQAPDLNVNPLPPETGGVPLAMMAALCATGAIAAASLLIRHRFNSKRAG